MDVRQSKQFEPESEESSQFLRAFLDSFPGNVAILDHRGRIVLANQAWLDFGRMNGPIEGGAWIGRDYRESYRDAAELWSEEAGSAYGGLPAVLADQGRYVEYQYACRNAHQAWWFQRRVSAFTHAGRRWIVVADQDITERKRAEDQLRYQADLLQHVSEALIGTDLDFRIESWNAAAERMYGWQAHEVMGQRMNEVVPGEYPHDSADHVLAQFQATGKWEGEVKQKRKDGGWIDVLSSVALVKDEAGEPKAVVAINRSITARKQAEQAWYESEERFRATFEQAAVGIAHIALDGSFLRLNRRFCEIVGYSHDEMLARTFQDITHPEDLNTDLEHVRQLLAGEAKTYTMEKRYLRKNGQIVWVNLTGSLLRKATGEPDYFVGVVEDITERKQAEEALRVYQQKLQALASQLTLAEERERRRIAADLHDEVGQALAFARIQLAAARKVSPGPKATALLDEASDTLRQVIQDTRDLVFDLSSPLLNEIGLAAALAEWLEEQVKKKHGLQTEFIDAAQEIKLDKDVGAMLFRSARELLANVVRHAQARKVTVRLEHSGQAVTMVIRDDGRGFDPPAAFEATDRTAGFGLFSIRERMLDLGGTLEIISAPGHGCTAILTAPAGKG